MQIGLADGAGRTQRHGTFEHIFEFTNVAGKVIGRERSTGFAVQSRRRFQLVQNKFRENHNVIATLAKCRHVQFYDVDAVIEIFTKLPVRHHLPKVPVSRREDTCVGHFFS